MDVIADNNNKQRFGLSYVRGNWPELSIIFFIALYPFGEIMHVALLPLLFFSVVYLFNKGIYRQRWVWTYLVITGLFLIPILLTCFTAIVLDRHLEVVFQWIIYIAIGLVIADLLRKKINETLLLYSVAVLIMLTAFDGIFQFIFGHNILGNPLVEGRVTSFFYPRIRMTDLAYLSPFVFEAVRRYSVRGGAHQLAWLLIVPLALSVFLGGSRSGWIVMFIMGCLYIAYLIYRRQFPLRVFILASVLSVAAFLVSYQMSSVVQTRVEKTLLAFSGNAEDINKASTNRVSIYKDALTSISEHPWLGVGRYGFKEVEFETADNVGDRHRQAHLIILDVAVNTGVVGLLGYLIAFTLLVIRTVKAAGETNGMAYAMTVSVVVLMMPLNTYYGFYDVRPASLGLLLLSLSFVYWPETSKSINKQA